MQIKCTIMASIFTRILVGEIPGRIVAQDSEFFAILDIHPQTPGHTLVIPKQETDYIFDMDEPSLGRLMAFCKKLAPAIQKATGAKRIGVSVEGFAVPHVHVHLVPLHDAQDLKRPGYKAGDAELEDMHAKIRTAAAEAGIAG